RGSGPPDRWCCTPGHVYYTRRQVLLWGGVTPHPTKNLMAIFLDEQQVRELLDMDSCIAALEEAFQNKAAGDATIQPRRRLPFQGRRFHLMAASMTRKAYLRFKACGAA